MWESYKIQIENKDWNAKSMLRKPKVNNINQLKEYVQNQFGSDEEMTCIGFKNISQQATLKIQKRN